MVNLRELTFELDNELGSIGCRVETLSDVKTLLCQLKDDMDIAVHRGEEKFYYHEHLRQVRVLAELMYYSMEELNKNYEKAHSISGEIFKMVVECDGGQENE